MIFRRAEPPDPTDAELRARVLHRAQLDLDYLTHARILITGNAGRVPDISDPIAWAEWALVRRDDENFPATTYAALTGPFRAVFGHVHDDDDNPGFTDQPDQWKRFPERTAS